MRIAHVTVRFTPPGGIVDNIRNLSRRLRAEGDEVEVYAGNVAFLSQADRRTDESRDVDGIPVHRFPLRDGPWARFRLGWLDGLIPALAQSGVDVIHAHWHRLAPILEAAVAARRAGIPLVVTTHYHPAQEGEPLLKRGLIRVADYGFGATAYQSARAIIVQTELEARLVGRFAPRGRLRVIPPGVDLAEWESPEEDDLSGVRLPNQYFLYNGWIMRRKGVDVLIEAFARLGARERGSLVIVGRDLGERSGFQALARRLGVDESIVWLDPLPRPTYRAVMRNAAAFVLPSEWESFGLVLVDAMVARTPIIASSVGAIPDVVDGGRAGLLVPYGNVDALADALRSVTADPAGARARVQRGVERVRGMDWSVIAHRLHALYQEVARA